MRRLCFIFSIFTILLLTLPLLTTVPAFSQEPSRATGAAGTEQATPTTGTTTRTAPAKADNTKPQIITDEKTNTVRVLIGPRKTSGGVDARCNLSAQLLDDAPSGSNPFGRRAALLGCVSCSERASESWALTPNIGSYGLPASPGIVPLAFNCRCSKPALTVVTNRLCTPAARPDHAGCPRAPFVW